MQHAGNQHLAAMEEVPGSAGMVMATAFTTMVELSGEKG
jgi:hypothetical protein